MSNLLTISSTTISSSRLPRRRRAADRKHTLLTRAATFFWLLCGVKRNCDSRAGRKYDRPPVVALALPLAAQNRHESIFKAHFVATDSATTTSTSMSHRARAKGAGDQSSANANERFLSAGLSLFSGRSRRLLHI